MTSGSGGKMPALAPSPAPGEWNTACDSCRSAPGIPFCRVEWSFLCAGCAAVVHGHNWVVAVTPNPNPNSNPSPHAHPSPYPYPHPFPCPNPTSDPNLVVQLSSDEEGGASGPSSRRGRRRSAGKAPGHGRLESVMRYRQKRKSRTFEKTVRYANRKANAELMPRTEGKFARRPGGGEEAGPDADGEVVVPGASEELRPDASEVMGMGAGEEVGPDWAEEMEPETSDDAGRLEAGEDIRLQ